MSGPLPSDPGPKRRPPLFAGRGILGTLALVLLVAVAVGSVTRALSGRASWLEALGTVALAVFFLFLPWVEARAVDRRRGTLTVNDWGVTRRAGSIHEAIAWQDVAFIQILTTSDGPGAEDMFFALGSADGKGCLVPNGLAVEANLLAVLQARFPGLDNAAVARAAGSTTEAEFTLWTRPSEDKKA